MAMIEKRYSKTGIPSYRVLIRLKGYPAQSATFKRITDAKRWELQTEAAIKEGRYFQVTEAKKHTFNELVSRYCAEILPSYNEKERQNRQHKLDWWASVMGDCLLAEHAKIRRLDTDLLFPGTIHKNKPIDLRTPFEKALKTAGINDFHWHDLRHCCASYLAMNGASLGEIAEILGHRTLSMVQKYSHLSDSHVSSVVGSMNKKIFS